MEHHIFDINAVTTMKGGRAMPSMFYSTNFCDNWVEKILRPRLLLSSITLIMMSGISLPVSSEIRCIETAQATHLNPAPTTTLPTTNSPKPNHHTEG